MIRRSEQVNPAAAVLQYRVRGVNVTYAVTLFREDDGGRIGIALGILGVDIAREGRSVVREQAQAMPPAMCRPLSESVDRGSRCNDEVRLLRDVRRYAVESIDPHRATRAE